MSKLKTVCGASLVAMGLLSGSATASVIDFDSTPASNIKFQSISVGGFDFANTGGPDSYTYIWGGDSPNSNGTNNLICGFDSDCQLTITRTGGGSFDLASIDMALSWYIETAPDSVLINGIPIVLTELLTTVNLSLHNVSKVTISGLNAGYWLADNINITPSAVPIPAAFPLLAGGLGVLGLASRRRRPKQHHVAA